MNDENEIERTADRLKAALGAAGAVMVVRPALERQRVKREFQGVKRAMSRADSERARNDRPLSGGVPRWCSPAQFRVPWRIPNAP